MGRGGFVVRFCMQLRWVTEGFDQKIDGDLDFRQAIFGLLIEQISAGPLVAR